MSFFYLKLTFVTITLFTKEIYLTQREMKGKIIGALTVFVLAVCVSSCAYKVCPTYGKKDMNKKTEKVQVKENM